MMKFQPVIKAEGLWVEWKEDLITLRPGRERAWVDVWIERLLRLLHNPVIEVRFLSRKPIRLIADKELLVSILRTSKDSSLLFYVTLKLSSFAQIDERKSESKDVVYYKRSRINKLAVGIITILILVLLVIPIYILYQLVMVIGDEQAYRTSIGILVVFTLGFSSVLALFTRAQRHEILAAAAA